MAANDRFALGMGRHKKKLRVASRGKYNAQHNLEGKL